MTLNNSILSTVLYIQVSNLKFCFYVSTIEEVITGPDLGCQLLLYISDAFVLMSSMVCVRGFNMKHKLMLFAIL